MPGVRLILTAADIKGVDGLPCKGKIRQVDGTHPKMPAASAPRGDVVRHVGDPIAFVVADDPRGGEGRGRGDRGRLRADCRWWST